MAQFAAALKADILPVKIDLRPFLDEAADFATKEVKGLDLKLQPDIIKIGTVEQGLSAKASNQALEESFENARKHADDLDSSNKKAIGELIKADFRLADDVADSKILARAGIDKADDAIRRADDALGGVADLKPKVGKALLDIADLFGKLFDVLGLIATLGTAIRMEHIYSELKQVDAALQNAIDALSERVNGTESVNEAQQADIENLKRLLEDLRSLNNSQFQTLLNAIEGQRQWLEPTYNNTNQLLDDVDSLSGKVDSLTDLEIQTQTKVDSGFGNLPPIIKDKVCEALNDDCNPFNGFDFGHNNNNNNDVDLSEINSLLNQINGKLGSFPYNCGLGDLFPVSSVSDGLRRLTCGFGFDGDGGNNNGNGNLTSKEDLTTAKDEIKTELKQAIANSLINLRGITNSVRFISETNNNRSALLMNAFLNQNIIAGDSYDWQDIEIQANHPYFDALDNDGEYSDALSFLELVPDTFDTEKSNVNSQKDSLETEIEADVETIKTDKETELLYNEAPLTLSSPNPDDYL